MILHHNPPEFAYTPCVCLCIYFDDRVQEPVKLITSLVGLIGGRYSTKNFRVRLTARSQTKPIQEVLREGNLTGLPGQSFSEPIARFANRIASMPTLPGIPYLCCIDLGPRVSIDGYLFYPALIKYTHPPYEENAWDEVADTNRDGPSLIVSFCPAALGADVENCLLIDIINVASAFGTVCHGVIDNDIYVANSQDSFYEGTFIEPRLLERERAMRAWKRGGGAARRRLCRDPREGLLLGASLSKTLGIQTREGEALWRSRHSFAAESPGLLHLPQNLALLKCSPDPTDFKQSVRVSHSTRSASKKLFSALCDDGFSSPAFEIQHPELLEIWDQGTMIFQTERLY